MKIAIVAPSSVPFIIGGAEKLWWGMLEYLNQHTEHQAELIKIPSPESTFLELVNSYKEFTCLDLSHFDCVISTKYPAWMISHPNHICYLQHKLRGLYDTYHFCGLSTKVKNEDYPTKYAPLLRALEREPSRYALEQVFEQCEKLLKEDDAEKYLNFPGPLTRKVIHFFDDYAQRPEGIRRYAAISKNVASRENYFPKNQKVHVLHHPSDLNVFKNRSHKHIFTISRLDAPKRLDLLIRAYKNVDTNLPLLIAGSGPEEDKLRKLAADDQRIKFLGSITDREVIDLYADALFIPYLPYDEDYGLITIEAMSSAKAVLTTNDSGGVLEFVNHEKNGWIAEPTVEAIALAIESLVKDSEKTIDMGKAAADSVSLVTWASVFNGLLEEVRSEDVSGLKLIVVSTFEVYPVRSGGQARIFNLYRSLSQFHHVTIVSLGESAGTRKFSPTFQEIVITRTQSQIDHTYNFQKEVVADVGDIAAIEGVLKNADFVEALKSYAKIADAFIVSHPYAFYAVEAVWRGAVIYDSHNVELDMKALILKNESEKNNLLEYVREVEERCLKRAELVFCCSENDRDRFCSLYALPEFNSQIVPNGVDSYEVKFIPIVQRKRNQHKFGLMTDFPPILYIGSWHQPNITGALRVVEIAKENPQLDFWFVGSMCGHPELQNLPKNIKPLGVLSDEEKEVVMSVVGIALNPIEEGSGTNLKLLDYAAAGIPIVTTDYGARGLDFSDVKDIFLSDLNDFSNAISEVLSKTDSELEAVTLAARKKVEYTYDWLIAAKRVSKVIKDNITSLS